MSGNTGGFPGSESTTTIRMSLLVNKVNLPIRFRVGVCVACLCRLLASLLFTGVAFAQYRFDHWTADNGLPQNSCLVDNSLPFNMEAFYAEVNERNNHPSSKQNLALSQLHSAGYHPGGSAGNRHDVYLRGADSQSRCGRGKCSRQDTDCGISKPGALEQ